MSLDLSRLTFDRINDFADVVSEQGRPQTDADWNEWVAERSRRERAETLDLLGHATYPATTPNAFNVQAINTGGTNNILIGFGRMYVDGILVENHGPIGAGTPWDSALAELSNTPQPQPSTAQPLDATNSILFTQQPYNPGAAVPPGPGQYVAFLDVWQRPVTSTEAPSLVDVAIGVETTGRIQTAWRVSLLPMPVVTVAGSVTSGAFTPGETVTQAGGATAILIGPVPANGPMILSQVTGTPTAAGVWSDSAGAQFTPSSGASSAVCSFIDGSVAPGSAAFQSGETVVQSGSGASAALVATVPAAGPMIVGPVSGSPAPLGVWTGQSSNAVFQPAALPSAAPAASIDGTIALGDFLPGELVVQQTSNASATVIGGVPAAGPMLVYAVTGAPVATGENWVGQTSGAQFSPTAAPAPVVWGCPTADSALPWPGSSGRLSTQPYPNTPSGPCCMTTGAGYTGPENQFYRVEIHTPGGASGANATFKWSRENASVRTTVAAIAAAKNALGAPASALIVQSLGRDQVLGFAAGDWIEITDATHDDNCMPGELYKIDSVDAPTTSIILTTPLSANFSAATLAANAYTRIVRWDQSGQVYKVSGAKLTPYYDLDAPSSSATNAPPDGCGGIPVPSDGSQIVLENGVAIAFGLALKNGGFQGMDYWNFTARTADGSIGPLVNAPPRGVAHHYTKLGIVTFTSTGAPTSNDCRNPVTTPAAGECGCCCSCTVGEGGKYGKIQQAVDSLPHGGEICVLPGTYYEYVTIRGKRGVVIRGCGERTIVSSPLLQPGAGAGGAAASGTPAVFTIAGSEDIVIEALRINAAEGDVGVLMDRTAVYGEGSLNAPDRRLRLVDLEMSASTRPAIVARQVSGLSVRESRIAMASVASLYPAVYLAGEDIRFERNEVRTASDDLGVIVVTRQPSEKVYKAAPAAPAAEQEMAIGGVQIGGPSRDVWIVENRIEGGSRNGVTLGNIISLDQQGNDTGTYLGVMVEAEDLCGSGATVALPGTTGSGSTVTTYAAGGLIRNLAILRNSISRTGMCGIGPVGFFNLNATSEIVSLVNVLIAENIVADTLTREVTLAAEGASSFGYGAIDLPDVQNLIIRDNIVTDYGVSPGAEVCGVYVHHGEGIDISRNQIRESRDLTGFGDAKWTSYGGKRAGIYIEFATPPTLDVSPASVWNQAVGEVYKTDASDTFRYQAPGYAPGFSALRIESNTVRVAFGLALYALGTGPFSILGNHFSTGGVASLDSQTLSTYDVKSPNVAEAGTLGALTVSILNLGLAVEAFDLLSFGALLDVAAFPATPASSVAVTNGTVLFSNNICQLMAQLNSVRGVSSVGVLTLDNLLFANNQLWMNGPASTAALDALLIGVSVQAVANRLQESISAVIASGLSVAAMNVTSQNASTYCFVALGVPQWSITGPNASFYCLQYGH